MKTINDKIFIILLYLSHVSFGNFNEFFYDLYNREKHTFTITISQANIEGKIGEGGG
jgi:hypothetical protein